jgi:hypothetical protein
VVSTKPDKEGKYGENRTLLLWRRVEVSADPDAVVACHCGECQRRTGSVFGVGAYFKKEHVRVEGPYNIYIRDGRERRKLKNHFCPTCGTTVF